MEFVVWCMIAMCRVMFVVCAVVRGSLCVGCRVWIVVCGLLCGVC